MFLLISWAFLVIAFFKPLPIEAASCKNPRPASPPILTSAVVNDTNVTLTWIEAEGPLTYYLLTYGTSPTLREYGNPYIGGQGTTSYTVSQLQRGVKYYFQVRAVNGCKPGKLSNKLSATAGVFEEKADGPNLTIFKRGLNSAAILPDDENIILGIKTIANSSPCKKCLDWQLLILEILLLVIYFNLSKKNRIFNKAFSFIVPLGIYFTFLALNGGCESNRFFCRFFFQLNLITFILFVILAKYKYAYQKLYKKL